MASSIQVIHIQTQAPAKPRVGAACNGCGLCCLAEPCPLGQLLSRRRMGRCHALRWDAAQNAYRCGAMVAPREVALLALPVGAQWLAPAVACLLGLLARRWIAAGMGCDSSLEAEPMGSGTMRPTGSLDSPISTLHTPHD